MPVLTRRSKVTLIEYIVYRVNRERFGGVPFRLSQEACYKALVKAMAEWGAANGISRVMLGLSGGLDSALVAEVAVRAFGADNVLTVFMPSEYTSTASAEDARALADNLKVEMLTMPIDGLRREASRCIEAANVGGEEGLWAENVQARLRAVLLMAVSNRRGHVLLNTSNRSEILVGYSTLYGDTCGAVSVLGDLYKSEVTSLAQWVNAQEQGPIIPERIVNRPPSAELRADQKDEDSLPKYILLDSMLAEIMDEVSNVSIYMEEKYNIDMITDLYYEVKQRMARSAFKWDHLPRPLRVYGREMPKRERSRGIR